MTKTYTTSYLKNVMKARRKFKKLRKYQEKIRCINDQAPRRQSLLIKKFEKRIFSQKKITPQLVATISLMLSNLIDSWRVWYLVEKEVTTVRKIVKGAKWVRKWLKNIIKKWCYNFTNLIYGWRVWNSAEKVDYKAKKCILAEKRRNNYTKKHSRWFDNYSNSFTVGKCEIWLKQV